MSYGILLALLLVVIYGPTLWVRFVLWRYSRETYGIVGSGGELAQHLIEKYDLTDTTVTVGAPGNNHYNPQEKIVALSPDIYHGKTLTAVTVAAHEIGHAIQFNKKEPVSQLREKYMPKAQQVQRIGSIILMSIPIVTIILRAPVLILLTAAIGIITMLASVLMYVAILPEEYDASFRKALPILQQGYIPAKQMPAAQRILRACAFTYIASALADVLRLWRWARILR